MKITRKSAYSGITRTKELDITSDQALRINEGELIQAVLPHLSSDDREFLLTGIIKSEWDELFKED